MARDPIAIIGIGCRLPGGVTDPQSYWRLLRAGTDAITDIPADRFDAAALYHEGAPAAGRIGTRWGGFLEAIDGLDAAFFGVSPREAERLDPQQRLLLETSWEALEDAGQPADRLAGSRAGVFVGLWLNDFEARLFADPAVDFHMTTGSGRYAASGRISYMLGLQGPSLTVDTACSSSLVAVHLACRSIWTGECSLAFAGGANVILQPHITVAYSQSGMMAADGRCKFGDARANGYVRSEGAAVVLLKPLAQALVDGDRIYAVIHGSAINNDGRSGDHMTTPAQHGQEQLLRLAYADAGISPGQVSYVEAHGTGTAVGDPVELGALGAVLGEGRMHGHLCATGSVKTNVGHTEGAAGVAGLIKAALVLQHREVPASLHLKQPNPAVAWSDLPLFIPTVPTPLPGDGSAAYAGVSSFGITGTNAHVVLGEAPPLGSATGMSPAPGSATAVGAAVEPSAAVGPSPEAEPSSTARPLVVPLSARSPAALRARAEQLAAHLAAGGAGAGAALADVAYTAARRRTHDAHRLAVICRDRAGLVEGLTQYAAGAPAIGVMSGESRAAPGVVFVFPGQGSQWPGMGRELLKHEVAFRRAIEECEAAMRPFVDWSLTAQLSATPGEAGYQLDRIDVVQPALVALDIALARLWRSWGIEPAAVIGHSMGETAAAHVAGALGLADAMRVICLRSRLLRRLSGQGSMAVVELSRHEAQAALAGFEHRVTVAASNSPRSTILSGDAAAVREVLEVLERQQVFCRLINVDVASHSPQVDRLKDELLEALQGIEPVAPAVPFHSTVLNRWIEGAELTPAYWVSNLREPVQFSESVQRLLAQGHDLFLEVSPHPVLLPAVQQTVQHHGSDASAFGSLRRHEDERQMLLGTLAALYTAGCAVDWQQQHATGRVISLPGYPWQRERFWFEPPVRRAAGRSGAPAHPLLPDLVTAANGTWIWEGVVSTLSTPYLDGHRAAGEVVLPAAAILELGLSAAAALGSANPSLEEFDFEHRIVPGGAGSAGPQLQFVVEHEHANAPTVAVFSRPSGTGEEAWTRCARGRLLLHEQGAGPSSPASLPPWPRHGSPGTELYAAVAERGLDYAGSFMAIREFWASGNSAVARIELPLPDGRDAAEYRIHPALLDAGLQLLLSTLNDDDADGLFLPVSVRRLQLHRRPEPHAPVWARAVRHDGAGLLGDVRLHDEEGRLILSAEGVQFRHLASPLDRARHLQDWAYEIEWQPQQAAAPARRPDADAAAAGGGWLVLADQGQVAAGLAQDLEAGGDRCIIVRPAATYRRLAERSFEIDLSDAAHYEKLLADVDGAGRSLRGVVHLCSAGSITLDDWSAEDLAAAQEYGTLSVLRLAQALVKRTAGPVPRLWIVTRGAHEVGAVRPVSGPAVGRPTAADTAGIAHAPLWGMAAVVVNEHPELWCTCIDLDPAGGDHAALAAELRAGCAEPRVAFRAGERFVARLVPAKLPQLESGDRGPDQTREVVAPYGIATTGAGVLDDLYFRPRPRPRPGPGEVEIEVRAVGLNFMNVMSALGTYPGYPNGAGPLGIECAGVVSDVGDDAGDVRRGDRVVAFAFDCLGTHAIANAHLVARMGEGLNMEQAAGTPIAFLTAWYALEHLAKLRAGERVLIHSASGGVGLAAIQLARLAGAEVLATAGTEEKRSFLRLLGIRHVFDSRSLDFAAHVMQATKGEGVDVVLNSLSGEAVAKGLSVLRPYGRFLELGKRDIHEGTRVSLDSFRKQLSYFAIDLDRTARERPELLGRLLRQVMAGVSTGALSPLPRRVFPASEVVDAFRHMAGAQHTGKIVIRIEPSVTVAGRSSGVGADGSYLITGGHGALGLAVARWLVGEGARHLVLLARSEATPAVQAAVAELESMGAVVASEIGDVAQEADVVRVVDGIAATMPPLRGVIHAAGVLADGTLLQLDAARFMLAMAPKLRGAWNLDRATRDLDLDFFTFFSSVAATLGIPGQANYAAGNAFLDALARSRRARGLRAQSIAWGPWSQVGLAASRQDRGRRLHRQGLRSLSPGQCLGALAELLRRGGPAAVAVAGLDAERWCAAHAGAATSPLLELLRRSEGGAQPADSTILQAVLTAGDAAQREGLLEAHLRTRVAQVLRLTAERVTRSQPLKAMGMDSLMSLELRNRLEVDFGVKLSATTIWNYPTIQLLSRHLGDMVGVPAGAARSAGSGAGRAADSASSAVPQPAHASAPALAAKGVRAVLREVDRSQIESLLDRELAAIDELLKGS